MNPLAAVAGVLLDQWLGEPRRAHPLILFGALATRLERRLNRGRWRRPGGLVALSLLVLPPTLVALQLGHWFGLWLEIPLLWLVLGGRSLSDHALAVARPLQAGDLPEARRRVARIVSRDALAMDRPAVTRATIESVLENGNDALFAPLFWFLLAGAPGALAYRLVNTLDAMWGYRTGRYRRFGWGAARLDDLLNWLPARLTAIGYALAGDRHRAFRCWRRQAAALASPNGGVVMTAGAGALGITLGGPAHYRGEAVDKPWFGGPAAAQPADIARAVDLLENSLLLWLLVLVPGGLWLV